MYERVRQWMWEMREWEKKERVRAGLLCSNFRAWPKVISSHINEIKRSVACQDFQGAPFQWWMNPFIAWIRFNVYFHFGFILLIVISNSQFGVWPIWFNSTKRQHEKKKFSVAQLEPKNSSDSNCLFAHSLAFEMIFYLHRHSERFTFWILCCYVNWTMDFNMKIWKMHQIITYHCEMSVLNFLWLFPFWPGHMTSLSDEKNQPQIKIV